MHAAASSLQSSVNDSAWRPSLLFISAPCTAGGAAAGSDLRPPAGAALAGAPERRTGSTLHAVQRGSVESDALAQHWPVALPSTAGHLQGCGRV